MSFINVWYKNFLIYGDQAAWNFLRNVVPDEYHPIIQTSSTFNEYLETLGTYCANEDLYLQNLLEEMKSHKPAKTFL